MAFYLRTENQKIEFLTDEIHEIKNTDMLLSTEEYEKFFELQSQGKQYRLKTSVTIDENDKGLFGYIEEFENESIPSDEIKSDFEMIIEQNKTLMKENQSLKEDIIAIKEMLGIN